MRTVHPAMMVIELTQIFCLWHLAIEDGFTPWCGRGWELWWVTRRFKTRWALLGIRGCKVRHSTANLTSWTKFDKTWNKLLRYPWGWSIYGDISQTQKSHEYMRCANGLEHCLPWINPSDLSRCLVSAAMLALLVCFREYLEKLFTDSHWFSFMANHLYALRMSIN